MHSKAASHLKAPAKRSSMLTPQKQGAPDHGSQLHTPDAKRVGAGGDSSVSAEASLLSLSPQALTPNLMVLNQVLGECSGRRSMPHACVRQQRPAAILLALRSHHCAAPRSTCVPAPCPVPLGVLLRHRTPQAPCT
jgi:hypothetical protein